MFVLPELEHSPIRTILKFFGSKTEILHFTFHKFGMSSRTMIRRQSDGVFQLLPPPL
jgi:hypothetical protein